MLIEIALNAEFSSLNLAQAVLIIGYEWFLAHASSYGRNAGSNDAPSKEAIPAMRNSETPSRAEERAFFLNRLETLLAESGFFKNPQMRPETCNNLRAFFQRARPSSQELRSLHGVLRALHNPRPQSRGSKHDQHRRYNQSSA